MASSEKLDLCRQHKQEYVTAKTPRLVEVGPARYLTITGEGEPGGETFVAKMQAMYGAAFTIKMARKQAGRDYKVCHLEGLWWGKRRGQPFAHLPKEQWNWKLMIRVPEFVGEPDLAEAVAALKKKGKGPDVARVRLETIDEGRCVQMLHVGPYATEDVTIEAMTAFVKDQGLSPRGLHHEIYLSDPRRVAPERLRTILRNPVE